MNRLPRSTRGLLFALALLLAAAAHAQYAIPAHVLAGGASAMSGPSYQLHGTIGQPVIGLSTATNYQAQQGFWFEVMALTSPGAAVDEPVASLPRRYSLAQNYPNPFNPSTQIRFALPNASHVAVKVYNVEGGLVETLAEGDFPAGEHQLLWNAARYASGTYIVSMAAPGFAEVRKAVLLK